MARCIFASLFNLTGRCFGGNDYRLMKESNREFIQQVMDSLHSKLGGTLYMSKLHTDMLSPTHQQTIVNKPTEEFTDQDRKKMARIEHFIQENTGRLRVRSIREPVMIYNSC